MATESPWFKFKVNQWLTGDITSMSDAMQGFFIRFCAYYWSQDCDVTVDKAKKKFSESKLKKLEAESIIKRSGQQLLVKFLDEQYDERQNKSKTNSNTGREGGIKSGESRRSRKQNEATASPDASTQRSQLEEIREEEKREEREREPQTNFLRVGTELYRMPPSEYVRAEFDGYYQDAEMKNGEENCAAALKKMDSEYYGYSFKEVNHVRNTFKTCLKIVMEAKTSTHAGAKPNKVEQAFTAHEQSKKMLGL